MIEVQLPVRTWSEANQRGHWGRRARRARMQREAARLLVLAAHVPPGWDGLLVTLTRIAPRILDTDNLASGLKAVRDGVADALGVDDGSSRVEWRYAQEKGKRQYAIRVEIRCVPGCGG